MQHFEAAKGRSQEGLLPYIYIYIYIYIRLSVPVDRDFNVPPKKRRFGTASFQVIVQATGNALTKAVTAAEADDFE